MKFFSIHPALNQQQLITNNDKYMEEIQMIKRFVTATQACLYQKLPTERVVSDLHDRSNNPFALSRDDYM